MNVCRAVEPWYCFPSRESLERAQGAQKYIQLSSSVPFVPLQCLTCVLSVGSILVHAGWSLFWSTDFWTKEIYFSIPWHRAWDNCDILDLGRVWEYSSPHPSTLWSSKSEQEGLISSCGSTWGTQGHRQAWAIRMLRWLLCQKMANPTWTADQEYELLRGQRELMLLLWGGVP